MRQRQKLILGGAIGAAIVVALIVGGLIWRGQHHKKQLADATQTVGNHTVSLNQLSPNSSSDGLSVSGQADSLGQLDGNNDQSQSQSSNGNSSSGDVNPASFSQYDKYQSSQNALFGDIQPGSGSALAAGQKASIYYKVWLTNGALVDQSPVSSSGQPQPFTFTLGAHQVIVGLEQGVAGMKVGGKRLVIVPPAVGYGSQGQGTIPGNAVLVFEVQLLSAN
ncbi:MAG TPA: FKBP-type peptidyl-prolyl cis-trans isomerase [Candidatus Saccharimonadales bacterium]|nr:FKBP-type peptidyl-prolyl cis-trans isomerase [Candidatus Saccharimonadales bacterium]